jgi:hypothetical protein
MRRGAKRARRRTLACRHFRSRLCGKPQSCRREHHRGRSPSHLHARNHDRSDRVDRERVRPLAFLLHSRALIGTKLAEEPNGLSASAKMNEYKGKVMMRTWFLRVAIGTFAAISLGASAAHAQSAKPTSPGEIAAASDRIAQRNEDCRRQAREQHLHLVKRYRFIRDCKRR